MEIKYSFNGLKHRLAIVIATIALAIASTTTSYCMIFFFDEPKMPESLYKYD